MDFSTIFMHAHVCVSSSIILHIHILLFAEREKKAFRASLLTANLDQQAMLEMQEKIERCTKILDHLETSDVIKVCADTPDSHLQQSLQNRSCCRRRLPRKRSRTSSRRSSLRTESTLSSPSRFDRTAVELTDVRADSFMSFVVPEQVEEMEAKKRKEVTDLDELKNQYHELKYSGEVTITQ